MRQTKLASSLVNFRAYYKNSSTLFYFLESHIGDAATEAGTAANQAAANKIAKYDDLAGTHIFYPVAIETGVPGITGLLSLTRRLADGPHCPLANTENPPFCFSSCQ